jgi:uncharacterized membrane protein
MEILMLRASSLTLGLSLLVFGVVGCNDSKPGGPGASHSSDKIVGKPADSFTVSAPATATNVKQGEKNTLKFTVKRGKDFKQDVKLSFEGGKKLTFDPKTVESKASDTGDVSVNVMPEDDAPLGKQTITVRAKPEEGGSETTTTFEVNVEKK